MGADTGTHRLVYRPGFRFKWHRRAGHRADHLGNHDVSLPISRVTTFYSRSPARKKSQPSDHQQLYDVVEEMKIASGLEKMPDIYIIDDPSLNAFATGRDPNHAAVSITSGLLQKLNRDELQGVIGHEISHIKHRDVLLMSMCSVLLGTIVILSFYASRMMMLGAIFGGGGGGGGRRGNSTE